MPRSLPCGGSTWWVCATASTTTRLPPQFVREHRDKLGALIDSSYSLDDAQAAFERLEAGERERPKVMLSIDK